MLQLDWGQCLWTGSPGWIHFSKRSTGGVLHTAHPLPGRAYVMVLGIDAPADCWTSNSEGACRFHLGRGSGGQLFTFTGVTGACSSILQYMCFVDLEKGYNSVPWGILWGGSMGCQRYYYKPFGSCVVFALLAGSQALSQPAYRSAQAVPWDWFIMWFSWTFSWGAAWVVEGVQYEGLRIASPLFAGDVALGWFAAESGAAGMRNSLGTLPEKNMDCSLQSLPRVKYFKSLWVLFKSEGELVQNDRQNGAATAEEDLSRWTGSWACRPSSQFPNHSIYIPSPIYGHEVWLITKELQYVQRQPKWVSFAGFTLRDRVRSSHNRKAIGADTLLLHLEWSQPRWFRHLIWMPTGRFPAEVFRVHPTRRRPQGRLRICWKCTYPWWHMDYLASLAAHCDQDLNRWYKIDGCMRASSFMLVTRR